MKATAWRTMTASISMVARTCVLKIADVVSGDDALCFKTTSSTMACSNIVVSGMRFEKTPGGNKNGHRVNGPI